MVITKCILYPDNIAKSNWDLVIIVLLFFLAITLPYRIAFVEHESVGWVVVN